MPFILMDGSTSNHDVGADTQIHTFPHHNTTIAGFQSDFFMLTILFVGEFASTKSLSVGTQAPVFQIDTLLENATCPPFTIDIGLENSVVNES